MLNLIIIYNKIFIIDNISRNQKISNILKKYLIMKIIINKQILI